MSEPTYNGKPLSQLTDEEWARAFVACKIPCTGFRFAETVAVLVAKLARVRQEGIEERRKAA